MKKENEKSNKKEKITTSTVKEKNNNFHKYLWYVIIFSMVGLLAEFIYGFVITKKGFILGPLAIIYGMVAGIDIAVLKKYKGHKVKLFILGAVLVTAIQYAISFLFEGILRATFWNYSEIKFNLNGRACVLTSILWGILTVIVIEFVQKWLDKILDKKPKKNHKNCGYNNNNSNFIRNNINILGNNSIQNKNERRNGRQKLHY